MSDPTKLEIGMEVTGTEVAGQKADELKKSIFGATDAAKESARQADVDVVKAQQAAEAQKAQAESLKEVVDLQQRIVAAQLAQALGQISNQFKGMSPEIELAVNAGQSFLNVFASTGDPIKATLALTASAIGSVVTAYRLAEDQVKQIAKTEQENLKHIAELRANYAAQVRAEGLEAFFSRELTELEKQEKALERIVKIRASERELEAARQATAGKEAVNNGADPNAVAAGNLETATAGKVAALEDSLTQAQAAFDAADKKVSELRNKAKLQIENSDAYNNTLNQIKTAEKSKLDLAAFTTVTQNQIQTAIEQGKQAGADISKAGLTSLTEAVTKERDVLKAEVARLGSKSSSGVREALAAIEKILADGVIKPEELAALREAQFRVRSSQEASNALVKEGFLATEKALASVLTVIQPAIGRINAMEQQIQNLRDQFSTLN